jgi:parvulin-like peptidyl-prolyl isomerase
LLARQFKRHPIKKQESPSQSHKHRVKQEQSAVPTVLIVLLLLVGAGYYVSQETSFFQNVAEWNPLADKGPVAAVVMNTKIYTSEVDTQFNQIPDAIRGGLTKEIILDQIISQEVLIQEAKEQGIKVTNAELDAFIGNAIDRSGWTRDEFEKVLMAQGMTISDLRDLYRVSLVIEKLLNVTVLDTVEVTQEEIEEYYNERINQFQVPQDQVEASHILIQFSNETRTEEEAQELATELAQRARDGEDFATLAVEYSEDPSVVQNEGYLGYFVKEQMVAPFADAAFALDVGDISDPVESQFGYHVIYVTGKRSAGDVVPLDDVAEAIETQLLSNKQRVAVEDYIAAQLAERREAGEIQFVCPDESLVRNLADCPEEVVEEAEDVMAEDAMMDEPEEVVEVIEEEVVDEPAEVDVVVPEMEDSEQADVQ